jgi:hypothetical protein
VLRVLDDIGDSAPPTAVPSLAAVVEEETYMRAPRVWCCRSVEVFGCERPNHVQVPAWMDPDFHPRLDGSGIPRLRNNECACEVGWGGTDCAVPTCPNGCSGTGTCAAPGICDCFKGWTGVDCRNPICDKDCGNHGDCLKPGSCQCEEFWFGPECSHNCVNGRVVTKSKQLLKCACDKGWSWENCATPVCRGLGASAGCGGHGTCVAPNSCQCHKGFSGPDCSVIRGSNGKFFFTSEESKRWAQDSFAVKNEQLKTAEHDLLVAQRQAERKAARERHVYHLADSSSVAIIDEEEKNDAGEVGVGDDKKAQTPSTPVVSKSKARTQHAVQLQKNESSSHPPRRNIDLRELARRQFPHASEQELDMLPKDKLFNRGAVHSAVPDQLDEALHRLETENTPEAAELFWEDEELRQASAQQDAEWGQGDITARAEVQAAETPTSKFEDALKRAAEQRVETRKTEDALIEAGTSFVEAIVEAEEDGWTVPETLASIEQQDTDSTAAAIATAKAVDIDESSRLTETAEEGTDTVTNNYKDADGLFWDSKAQKKKRSHAQKDIHDLLKEEEEGGEEAGGEDEDAGKSEFDFTVAAAGGKPSTDAKTARRGGGSLVVTAGNTGNAVKMKSLSGGAKPVRLADVKKAVVGSEAAVAVAAEADEVAQNKSEEGVLEEGWHDQPQPPPPAAQGKNRAAVVKKAVVKSSSPAATGITDEENKLRSKSIKAGRDRHAAETVLRIANANAAASEKEQSSSSTMIRGS